MTYSAKGSSSTLRVESEAQNPFIVNGKKNTNDEGKHRDELRLLQEEKLKREVVGTKAETKKKTKEEEKKVRKERLEKEAKEMDKK